jgi:hypothetical protein
MPILETIVQGYPRYQMPVSNPTSSFRLPCALRLEATLGKSDAIVECTELSIREFIMNSLSATSTQQYIQGLSAKHSIRVDNSEMLLLSSHISQLYIITVYAQAEEFLESFRDEHPLSPDWQYEGSDDLLKKILKNIKQNYQTSKKLVGSLEVELFDHYRMVRNRFVHIEIDTSKIDSRVWQLREEVKTNSNYCQLNAPNIYSDMSFDDFILFTRVVKQLAFKLCQAGRPSDRQLADTASKIIQSENSSLSFQKLKQLKFKPDRVKNCLETFLRELYGLDKLESSPIAQMIQNDLLA